MGSGIPHATKSGLACLALPQYILVAARAEDKVYWQSKEEMIWQGGHT